MLGTWLFFLLTYVCLAQVSIKASKLPDSYLDFLQLTWSQLGALMFIGDHGVGLWGKLLKRLTWDVYKSMFSLNLGSVPGHNTLSTHLAPFSFYLWGAEGKGLVIGHTETFYSSQRQEEIFIKIVFWNSVPCCTTILLLPEIYVHFQIL